MNISGFSNKIISGIIKTPLPEKDTLKMNKEYNTLLLFQFKKGFQKSG